ncbi:MAG TPA: ATP-dependent helicase, partial [bacterium]|nr:ATP-dependent helicase [bacterium]
MKNKIPFEAIINEASAGTGKTYSIIKDILKLKEYYGSYKFLNKIIGITFSENAAIELKERLIKEIFDREYERLSDEEKIELENILLRLNFSTIHSFAKKILKRFAFILHIDPFFKIIEEKESDILFSEALSKTFLDSEETNIFYKILKELKLNQFSQVVSEMKKLHPYVFLGSPHPANSLTELISKFFKNVEEKYFNLKKELGYLDFNDLEKLTFKLLNENLNIESLIILEDFDEKMNFIFLDEFQDTNLLQWKIIENLIKDWLSGYGSKAETGERYGIYIVGDKKQSIYRFRGAESKLFDEVKRVLNNYCKVEKLKINYRSTKEIIDFVNTVFKNDEEWKEEELVFNEKMEKLPSKIEISSFSDKEKEYEWVCNKICSLIKDGNLIVFDRKNKKYKKIELRDILILIRKRNKDFKLLEEKLKSYNIPYVVIGGIGFYQEPEIKFLLSLLYALVDPTDKYALWNLENSIFKIDKNMLNKWRELMNKFEILFLMEKILEEIKLWDNLNTQQTANVEKFLSILQNQSHLPYYQITKNFRELSKNTLEPKADIFSVHQNAVKIMTIHRAKGLESPVVFLINVEDLSYSTKNDVFFYKKEGDGYVYVYKKDDSNDKFKNEFKGQMEKEENRLFYVALTRAMQYLFISGNIEKNSAISNKVKEIIK